jgi:hypothetical protein
MRRALIALALAGCDAPAPRAVPVDASSDVAPDAPPDVAPDAPPVFDAFGPDAPEPLPDVPRDTSVGRDVPAAANATCSSALPVTPGVTLPAQQLSRGVEVPRVCEGDGFAPVASLWYRLRVPEGQHLAVTVRRPPASYTDVALRAFHGCGGPCAFGGDIVGDDFPSLRWTNPGPDADIVLSLSSGIPAEDLPTDVTVTLSSPPLNIACERATPLSDGVPLRGEDPGFARDALAPCEGMHVPTLRPLYYRITVPARRVLTVSMTTYGYLAVLPACGVATCLTWAAPTPTGSSTSWENPGDSPREVIVAVAKDHVTTRGTLDVTAALSEPAAHQRCASPRSLTSTTLLRDEQVGTGGDVPRSCASEPALGPGRYYAAHLGAGEEFSATATTTAGNARGVSLRLVDGCAAASCLAPADPSVLPGPWVRYRNEGSVARDVLLEASASPGEVAIFDLRARVAPPGYTLRPIAAACDDMRGAAAVQLPCCGYLPAPSQPLPFPLRFFGEPVAAWSASNYGYLELWPERGGTPPSAGPVALPSGGAMRVVAPFWSPMSSTAMPFVVARTVDSPRRHLTVQWSDAVVGGSSPERITFQAQLYADDSIEFHYCAVTPGDAASGASASIGLQGDVVPRAVSYAFRRAGAVAAGTALRFTP